MHREIINFNLQLIESVKRTLDCFVGGHVVDEKKLTERP